MSIKPSVRNITHMSSGNTLFLPKVSAEKKIIRKIIHLISGHEFKTPLTTILGISELLRENFVPTEQKKVYYQFINDSGQRLEQLSSRIRSWYHLRYEPDQYKLTSEIFKVSTIEHLITNYKKKELKYAPTEVITDIRKVTLLTNNTVLETVLKELIDNAFKHSAPQTKISFSIYSKQKDLFIAISNYMSLGENDMPSTSSSPIRKLQQGLGLEIIRLGIEHMGGKIKVSQTMTALDQKQAIFLVKIPILAS